MSQAQLEAVRKEIRAAQRAKKIKLAADNLLDYRQFTMPHPDDPEDATRSQYVIRPMHEIMAEVYAEAERAMFDPTATTRFIVLVAPPRHGKTELGRGFMAQFAGKYPHLSSIFATYNQPFADENGENVRDILMGDAHRLVFPQFGFKRGISKPAADHMPLYKNGNLYFVGIGGTTTGRGGDFNFIDDLIKDEAEAKSEATRNEAWDWFVNTFLTRRMNKNAIILMQGTRWHADDPIGRLTDKSNPHFSERIYKRIKIIHIAAVARVYGAPEEDPLGREPYEVPWPDRFDLEFFEDYRALNPTGFAKLYQGVPHAADGSYFTREMIRLYQPSECPPVNEMRIYAASDHAVGQDQVHDFTVLLIVGVDKYNHIWLLDCVWERMKTDRTVDELFRLFVQWKPIIWWGEGDHIFKSLGPFIEKRSREENIYPNLHESPIKNKDIVMRAQPLMGRMKMGMIHIPLHAPWRERAVNELLKFDNDLHDDFVSALSHIGQGLSQMVGFSGPKPREELKTNSIAWIKQQDRYQQERRRTEAAMGSL